MNNHYLFIIILPFVPLTAMEQSALLVQKPALKKVSTLQEIALKAYAKHLHKNAPKEALSEPEMIEWVERLGLNTFFDLEMGSLLDRVLSEPIIDPAQSPLKKTLGYCPIFSPDGSFCLQIDFENKKQYLVYYHDESIHEEIPEYLAFDTSLCGRNPIISLEGNWLLGSSEKTDTLFVMRCVLSGDKKRLEIAKYTPSVTLNNSIDYTFLDEETILLRNAKEIFSAPIADFALRGNSALQKIYSRNDGKEFLNTPRARP